MENTITRNQILSILSQSPHGDYKGYMPVVQRAAKEDPEFLAHFISWNRTKGQIRDSKVALPVISLNTPEFQDKDFIENSLAHLAMLDPRNLVKAYKFYNEIRGKGNNRKFLAMIKRYLRYRESNYDKLFMPAVTAFGDDMKYLYRKLQMKRDEKVGLALFGGEKGKPKVEPPTGSVLEKLKRLKDMPNNEAIAFINAQQLNFLSIRGFMGERCKDPEILRVIVERMSPTELTSNMKWLEKMGYRNLPAVRGAVEQAITKAAGSTANILKTTKAIEVVEDEGLKERLRGLQEKQIRAASIEGDWAVLGDKSGSMEPCIEGARVVAATLAKMVKGKVHLIFFDIVPRYIEVTGKTYEEILAATDKVTANGGTSIGCCLLSLANRNIKVDGIAIVSDADENNPPLFPDAYNAYCQSFGIQPPVYLYRYGRPSVFGRVADLGTTMKMKGIHMDEFQMSGKEDYYSIPTLAQTMTTKRYGLVDQIYDCPLITLDMVFDGKLKNERRKKTYAH